MNNRNIKPLPKKLSVSKKPAVKVDSPLAKYDSSGNLTCIICRIPIKATVWKVHINSKQHKLNVDQAKNNKVEKSVTKPTTPAPTFTPAAKEASAPSSKAPPSVKTSSHQEKQSAISQDTGPQISHEKTEQANATEPVTEGLPEKFFDEDKSSKAEATRIQDEEWQRFQQEIKKASTESSVIVADEQEDINLKRQLKEIDEQIDNWKRFIKINDQKTILLGKKRKINIKKEIDPELSSSEEDCSVDDLYDWRSKNLQT
ncbi:uncharacterized protein Dana_GF17885 [Drosophila ananassae]|uniref:ZNF380 coiled-coil domain-containing protein n=1 Tax=Drosophila ananassae TaxID=7217 RepID=B3M1Y6_DROAN|nr:zinc finger protein 830 [Drosophila ananassae]EDV42246.2 uncharacterized protein Dana_GF17885 [Drosophila ananassae]